MLKVKEITPSLDGYRMWGGYIGLRPYVVVFEDELKEYTASTEGAMGERIFVLDREKGVPTLEEAIKVCEDYHKRSLA